jgi:hypothetical protein
MSHPRSVHHWGYVNHSFERVRSALHSDPLGIMRHSTASAAARAREVGCTLRTGAGPVDLAVDVEAHVDRVADEPVAEGLLGVTKVEFHWAATHRTGLFPVMKAKLSLWPIGVRESLLEFDGEYVPPFSIAGGAFDAVLGHRVAEATVHRFMEDVVQQLRASA